MRRQVICLALFGVVVLVANLTLAQDAPSVSTNAQTNSDNSAPSSGNGY